MIARLCLSDMHLGDPRSTLSNPEVAAKVAAELAGLSGGEVGELVLNGDVWEECVPGDMDKMAEGLAASVLGCSRTFFGALFAKIKVGKVVYVPGNHDLSLWSWYCRKHLGLPGTCTPYNGIQVDRLAWPWCALFPISLSGELVASYPIYWDRSAGSDYPILVFTHGHLLDPLVFGTDAEAAYVALRVLGCSRPPRPSDPTRISCVADASEAFCLALWARYSRRDYAYANYVMRRVDCPQQCWWQEVMPKDGCYPTEGAPYQIPSDQPPATQGRLGDVPRFLDLVMTDPNLPSPVGEIGVGPVGPAFSRQSCLVYGHDHLAARKVIFAGGVPFAAVGSGGWTSEHEGHLPHSHVLAWPRQEDVVPTSYFLRARTLAGGVL